MQFRILIGCFFILTLLVRCSPSSNRNESNPNCVDCDSQTNAGSGNIEKDLIFHDDFGNKINLKSEPQRIIGLAPSLTEILFTITNGDLIVGRTQNCNFPEEATRLPVVNTYPMDFEALLMLKPDLIFVQEGISNPSDIVRMRELGLNVYHVQKPLTVSKLGSIIEDISIIIGRSGVGNDIEVAYYEFGKQRSSNNEQKTTTVRVLALASLSPIYVYGVNTLFSDKISIAGGVNAMKDTLESPFPQVNSEYILKLDPEVILGGNFEKMDSVFFSIYPELKKTTAYKNRAVFAVTDDLMTRPSTRVIASVNELKEILSKVNAN